MIKLNNTYYILRHGQTVYQTRKRNISYPRFDRPAVRLTKEGEKQIKKAAKRLKSVGINLIFSSDFLRTKQTAKIVSKIVSKEVDLKIKLDKRLRDIDLGIYHGKLKKEFYQNFPKKEQRFTKIIPKGESWFSCQKRIVSFLKEVDKRYKGKTILIISHGDPLWLLEGAVRKWSVPQLLRKRKNNYIKTGEVRQLL